MRATWHELFPVPLAEPLRVRVLLGHRPTCAPGCPVPRPWGLPVLPAGVGLAMAVPRLQPRTVVSAPPPLARTAALVLLLACCPSAASLCTDPGPLRATTAPLGAGEAGRGVSGGRGSYWCLDTAQHSPTTGYGALLLAPCNLFRHTQWWHPPAGRSDQLAQAATAAVGSTSSVVPAACVDAHSLVLKPCPSPVRPNPKFTFNLDAQRRWVLSEGGKCAAVAPAPSLAGTRHRSGTASAGGDGAATGVKEEGPGGGAAADASGDGGGQAAFHLVSAPCDSPDVIKWEQPACSMLPPLLETHHNWARGAPAVLSSTSNVGFATTQQTVTPVTDGFPEDHGWSNRGCVGVHSGERDDELYPWVTLDLGKQVEVQTVQVWTRTACPEYSAYLCQNRLWRYTVYVGNEPPPMGLPEQGQYAVNGPPCASMFTDDDATPRPVFTNAECRKTGRYVTVQQMASLDVAFPGVLNICQIRVLGALAPIRAASQQLGALPDGGAAAGGGQTQRQRRRWKLRLPKLFRRKERTTPSLVTWRPPVSMGLTLTAVLRAAIDAAIATAALWAVLRVTPAALRACSRGLDTYGRRVPGAARLANALRRAGQDMPLINEAVFDGELGGMKAGGDLGDKES